VAVGERDVAAGVVDARWWIGPRCAEALAATVWCREPTRPASPAVIVRDYPEATTALVGEHRL
jgi:hypothetical protein